MRARAKRHGFAANQQHALVALRDARQEFLHHHGLCAALVERFDDHTQIQAVCAHLENAGATHAVQGLQDDVAMLRMKGADVGFAARDEGGRNELRKLQNRELFGVVAQAPPGC
jgi:hypothetical protein